MKKVKTGEKWKEFKDWKSRNLSYYNIVERNILQKLREYLKLEIVEIMKDTCFGAEFEDRFYSKVFCQGVEINYQEFIPVCQSGTGKYRIYN